jgi:hypothetical protein
VRFSVAPLLVVKPALAAGCWLLAVAAGCWLATAAAVCVGRMAKKVLQNNVFCLGVCSRVGGGQVAL